MKRPYKHYLHSRSLIPLIQALVTQATKREQSHPHGWKRWNEEVSIHFLSTYSIYASWRHIVSLCNDMVRQWHTSLLPSVIFDFSSTYSHGASISILRTTQARQLYTMPAAIERKSVPGSPFARMPTHSSLMTSDVPLST
jgi:hypothetical protein